MSKEPADLPPGVRSTDILTVTQFADVFPLDAVTNTLDSFGCGTIRFRDVSNERLVYFQMMLSLFRDCSQSAVYRSVAAAFDLLERRPKKSGIPTSAGLTQGLDRLKPEAFESLFQRFANPAGEIRNPAVGFRGRRKVSIDGFLMNTEDTKQNRKFFGGPSNQHGDCYLPQLRCVCFVETGSHLIFKAAIGGYLDAEIPLAKKLLNFVESDWILLADRNFYSFELYKEISERGAAIVFRLQKGMKLESKKQFDDGSHLVTVFNSSDSSKEEGLEARLVQYKVHGAKKKLETIYLITNILDPKLGSAEELGKLYSERWEHENTLDELKTHLNDSSLTLRSKNPERVIQELWGILMAHFAIRSLMYKAAVRGKIDPDRLSFTHTVNVVQDAVIGQRNASCPECHYVNNIPEKKILQEVLDQPLPVRRARSSERSVRRKRERYSPKKSKTKVKSTNTRVKVVKGWSYGKPRK